MFTSYGLWPHIRARIESGPLASYVEPYVARLEERGYTRRSVRCHIRGIDILGRWLTKRKVPAEAIDAATFDRFAARFPRRRSPARPRGRLADGVCWVRTFVEFLWERGVAARAPTRTATTADRCVRAFDEYLTRVQGLSPGTRRIYVRYARRFVEATCGADALQWPALKVDDLTEFVRAQAARLAPGACRAPVTATRAFLRYLASSGEVPSGLCEAIPTVRQWKHAALPAFLSIDEVDRVLTQCRDDTPIHRRDRAIMLLLARLGVRASEVAHLCLDDIDWRQGQVTIRAGKSGKERGLPLSADVGAALVAYLQDGRPKRRHRALFLQARPPYGPLSAGAVTGVAQRALQHAGAAARRPGAHVFRHSAATRMVRGGATFKQIADVLGHARIETTTIYAKLDLAALSRVALPWPGGAR